MSKSKDKLEAERLYNQYLKQVELLIGSKSTYLSEILGVGKKILKVKFKGVYPSDKIPKLNDLSPYCVLNLDKSSEPGSHWVALAKMPHPSKDTIFYDSFDRDYKQIIPNLEFSRNGRIRNTGIDKKVEQKIKEENCGARSIAWLILFDKHGSKMALLI